MLRIPANTLLRTIILFAGIMAAAASISAQPHKQVLPQAGYYVAKVGNMEITALCDGTFAQDMSKLLTNVSAADVEKLTALNFQQPVVELSVNAYLVRMNGKLILIDAGTADAFGPDLGYLPYSLVRAGIAPEQIDAVLITHMHPDHIGGLIVDGKVMFPNATVYVSKPEYEYWTSEKNAKAAPADRVSFFEKAIRNMAPYVKADRLRPFDYGNEIMPGVLPIARPGHTPGHSFYQLTGGGERVVFWGDILHAQAVQFVKPEVTIVYDSDPARAAASRKAAFVDAAKNGYWIAADHLSFPGIGRIREFGNGYHWFPINYSTTGNGQ